MCPLIRSVCLVTVSAALAGCVVYPEGAVVAGPAPAYVAPRPYVGPAWGGYYSRPWPGYYRPYYRPYGGYYRPYGGYYRRW